MRANHKPCPRCGAEMHRQSKRCQSCYAIEQGTDEVRARMSEQRMGKPSYERTPETRKRMAESKRGKAMPSLRGRKRPEHAEKMREWWTPERREHAREIGLLRAEDREWLLKIAEALSGENNPRYAGKGTGGVYAPGWGREYKRKLRARAEGKCERCGAVKAKLELHHADFTKTNHDPANLMVICRSCHKLLHYAHNRSALSSSPST